VYCNIQNISSRLYPRSEIWSPFHLLYWVEVMSLLLSQPMLYEALAMVLVCMREDHISWNVNNNVTHFAAAVDQLIALTQIRRPIFLLYLCYIISYWVLYNVCITFISVLMLFYMANFVMFKLCKSSVRILNTLGLLRFIYKSGKVKWSKYSRFTNAMSVFCQRHWSGC
jgi:hypothetical protein